MGERLTDQQLRILWEQWRPAAIELIALRARVAKMEAALRPFAAVADYEDGHLKWDERPPLEEDVEAEYWSVFYHPVRAKHFRDARAALKPTSSGP